MILEGNERGNGAELAQHLMNARDNEHVTVHAVDGFIADDLFGAFAEAEAIAGATQCTNYLFSVSLNPPIGAMVKEEEFEAVAARVAKSLGLDGQPFALVFHEKLGRRHAHCVWSRIDMARMKAVPMPHYKRRLVAISRELYIEHGWDIPAGFEDAQKRDPLNFSRQEAGQAKRVKRDAQTLKAMFQKCWQTSDNRSSFAAALWTEGYVLARGDRRGFVAVDAQGEIYSLSRWCGLRTKDLRARLGDPLDLLDVEEAVALFEARAPQDNGKSADTDDARRRKALDALVARQRKERDDLLNKQEHRRTSETRARNARLPKGVRKVWARISGSYDRIVAEVERDTTACDSRDRDERQVLINQHMSARRALEHNVTSIDLSTELETAFAAALRPDPRQTFKLPVDAPPFSQAQLLRNPALILDYLSQKQARFTALDIKRGLANFIDDPLQLTTAIDRALESSELLKLDDGDCTTRDYRGAEVTLFDAAVQMSESRFNAVRSSLLATEIAAQNAKMQRSFGGHLSEEQESALRHICDGKALACVVGLAGAGKSTMLEVANSAWRKQGIKVHGAALSGKAADGLKESSGIDSRTLASLELSWLNGYEPIGRDDVLVIDEAGMIGTRQLSRITTKLSQIGAKLVLIGDPDQLQPIEAGQPFRRLINRIGAARLTEIHRQQADWQKQASRDLADGHIHDAINAYDHNGAVHCADDQNQSIVALVEHYMTDRETDSNAKSRLTFAHRRRDVFALNQAIRRALHQSGTLGDDEAFFETDTGPRLFAAGDRVVFTANDKELGVKNGMLGTVEKVDDGKISVRLDDASQTRVTINANVYRSFDHGYAVTIHKSQGATVDQAYVLASRTMDAPLTYVAMTRHRSALRLYVNEKDRPKWLEPKIKPLNRSGFKRRLDGPRLG